MRFQGFDLNLIVALDALLIEQNVSVAAERIHLSQSAMSGALNRLREYFKDDLLVSQGRRMVLTPRAESLVEPVRQALLHIRSNITAKPIFDPRTSNRRFSLAASDYAVTVILGHALAEIAGVAPHLEFEIASPSEQALVALQRGEIDLYITLEQFVSPDHPTALLFEDDYVVVASNDNPLTANGVTEELYFQLGHVTVGVGTARLPAFDEWFINVSKRSRRVEIVAPSFVTVPQLLIGSRRITTMHRRLATHFAKFLPISIFEAPFPIPHVRQVAQWRRFNEHDQGVTWLVQALARSAGGHAIDAPPVQA